MSQRNHDAGRMHEIEAQLLANLRATTPEARERLLALSQIHVELFPVRPTLRLVKSDAGGGK